ncbi:MULTISPECIES: M48 family metallopeptidase [Sphingobacterium]|uniref:M48 family metallopeptidase n=1 Tax=Sphingobacterium populi TaxID=1812824 RepID=A0ABW5UBN0_9SPHI|nr:M48 family metallopeptidase [Sphingobacterium sp. CFCC 11742]
MKKQVIIEGILLALLFLVTWIGLAQVDWLRILKVETVTSKTEKKLGDIFLETFKKSDQEINNLQVTRGIDSIVQHICHANGIDFNRIKTHVLLNDQVNAFALPDGHLVIYTGLISKVANQEELTGVICHEIAHIELHHVMKKLIKEIGLSVLISLGSGNASGEILRESTKLLSSSAYDRKLEKEADIKAVDYLIQAQINPDHFANFLDRLSENDDRMYAYLGWINTHPDAKERAKYITSYSHSKGNRYLKILSDTGWQALRDGALR